MLLEKAREMALSAKPEAVRQVGHRLLRMCKAVNCSLYTQNITVQIGGEIGVLPEQFEKVRS